MEADLCDLLHIGFPEIHDLPKICVNPAVAQPRCNTAGDLIYLQLRAKHYLVFIFFISYLVRSMKNIFLDILHDINVQCCKQLKLTEII